MKQSINIVWFKRDFRIKDHQPLFEVSKLNLPVLLIAFIEPSLFKLNDYSEIHKQAVRESVDDLNKNLPDHLQVHLFENIEVLPAFQTLEEYFDIKGVYSYIETGLSESYNRDKQLGVWFRKKNINWNEYQNNGVIRGLKNPDNWSKYWYQHMTSEIQPFDLEQLEEVELPKELCEKKVIFEEEILSHPRQKLGENRAHEMLKDFLNNKSHLYSKFISKPEGSRNHCSRLSPYLAWGNISMRQVYQSMREHYPVAKNKRSLSNFRSRLFWHCHFIQKFENEERIEFENLNRAYDKIRNEDNHELLEAWKYGKTGIPLVDACARALIETGYLNFRMRAMMVSFLTHHLFQPWKKGAQWMASQLLDFEPGIHYSQFQMQAGSTGINTVRVYNPVKQAKDHDEDAEFIKNWVPELANLPSHLAIEPWTITPLESIEYNFKIGLDYPTPIVDINDAAKKAKSEIYKVKGSKEARMENERILKTHVKLRERKKVKE